MQPELAHINRFANQFAASSYPLIILGMVRTIFGPVNSTWLDYRLLRLRIVSLKKPSQTQCFKHFCFLHFLYVMDELGTTLWAPTGPTGLAIFRRPSPPIH